MGRQSAAIATAEVVAILNSDDLEEAEYILAKAFGEIRVMTEEEYDRQKELNKNCTSLTYH